MLQIMFFRSLSKHWECHRTAIVQGGNFAFHWHYTPMMDDLKLLGTLFYTGHVRLFPPAPCFKHNPIQFNPRVIYPWFLIRIYLECFLLEQHLPYTCESSDCLSILVYVTISHVAKLTLINSEQRRGFNSSQKGE